MAHQILFHQCKKYLLVLFSRHLSSAILLPTNLIVRYPMKGLFWCFLLRSVRLSISSINFFFLVLLLFPFRLTLSDSIWVTDVLLTYLFMFTLKLLKSFLLDMRYYVTWLNILNQWLFLYPNFPIPSIKLIIKHFNSILLRQRPFLKRWFLDMLLSIISMFNSLNCDHFICHCHQFWDIKALHFATSFEIKHVYFY